MKGELRKPASVNAILLIGIFTFVFLGAEYLFVNMISLSVTEGRTVIAQNYALGASAVGFFAPAPSAFSCIRPWNAGAGGAIKAR